MNYKFKRSKVSPVSFLRARKNDIKDLETLFCIAFPEELTFSKVIFILPRKSARKHDLLSQFLNMLNVAKMAA